MHRLLSYIAALLACTPLLAQNVGDDLPGVLVDAVQDISDDRLAEARTKLVGIIARDSTFDAAYYYLGMCDFYEGRGEAAVSNLSRAAGLDSTNNWYLESLAQVCMSLGRTGRAGELYLELLRRDPGKYRNSYTLTLLADQALSNDDDSSALAYYGQALLYDPEYVPALLGKADCHRYRGETADFFETLRQFVTDPTIMPDPKCRYLTSLLSSFDPRYFALVRGHLTGLMDDLAATHPDHMPAQSLKMEVLVYYEDWERVLGQCETMISLAPGDSATLLSCYSLMGDVRQQQGDMKGSFAAYEKALKVNPDYLPVLNNYAYYLSLQGKSLRKALKMSRKTIEAEPDNATYLDTYGWILHLLRRNKEAKPYFKHAMLYGGKDSAVVLAHYSMVLEALGEKELASYYRSLAESK